MKKFLALLISLVCFIACVGDNSALEGNWGMISGGIKKNGVFSSLDDKGDFYKTMEFNTDGTFTEVCGGLSATGTYKVKGGSSISYTYKSISGNGPEYFAIHSSGTWTYHFLGSDSFTLYDFSSSSFEVSMTFKRL